MERSGIYFFPFSEPKPVAVSGLAPGLLARRIPDFLCMCLNGTDAAEAELLEIRLTDNEGVPTGEWATLEDLPDPDDAMSFVPEEAGHVRALILGNMQCTQVENIGIDETGASRPAPSTHEIQLEMQIVGGSPAKILKNIQWQLDVDDLPGSCMALARQLGKELGIEVRGLSWEELGTKNTEAFAQFLQGLEGIALIDPELIGTRDAKELLMPLVRALEADPDFGHALRRLYLGISAALSYLAIDINDSVKLLSEAYSIFPTDREAASVVGEFLLSLDQSYDAEDWLTLAVQGEDPPATALETLGILYANRGDTIQARNLWLTGVRVDGHPDFFAHIARLGFAEDNYDEAWDKILRGLRRLFERQLHPGEWAEEEGRGGVLLRYLSEHLEKESSPPPPDVRELLIDLVPQIREPSDRLDLGLCLLEIGEEENGIQCLRSSVPHVEDWDRRDLGAQTLAERLFPNFEKRFERAARTNSNRAELQKSLAFFEEIQKEIPQFWPARYFQGRLLAQLEDWEAAAEAYRSAAAIRRDQAELHARLSVCYHKLGKIEDAIHAMESAVDTSPEHANYYADLALLQFVAGQEDACKENLEIAETLDPEHPGVLAARQQLLDNGVELEDRQELDVDPEGPSEEGSA